MHAYGILYLMIDLSPTKNATRGVEAAALGGRGGRDGK